MTAVERDTQKTVLLVNLGVAYGGSETYHLKLAKILQREFRLVAVVCCPRLADEFRALGIETEFAGDNLHGLRRYTASFRACWRMVRRYRPRLAHLNGQPESYLALPLRLLGLRLIAARHTPFTDRFMQEGAQMPVALKRWMVLLSLRCARLTICDSRLLVRQLAEHLPASRLLFVPTWVEDSLLAPYTRPPVSTPLRAVFVGRVVTNKGIFDAIEAVRLTPGVHLTVVGEGEQMLEAQRRAEGLPIHFAGFSADPTAFFRAADLALFTSPEGFEGLPQVPLEALALSVPCLAADISSVLEIAEDATLPPLALYRHGDVDDLVLQLQALVAAPERLAELSVNGRSQIERRFTVAAVAPAFLSAFCSVLE